MYKFTRDQLFNLLIGTIGLRDEYQHCHGFNGNSAATQATLDTLEGLDAEKELIEQGEKIKPTQERSAR